MSDYADAFGLVIDPERAPEFVDRLRTLPVDDDATNRALLHQATCWLDVDGRHVWFAHVCNGEWTEAKLVFGRPIGTKRDGGGWCATTTDPLTVAPSVSCDICGFHNVYAAGSF